MGGHVRQRVVSAGVLIVCAGVAIAFAVWGRSQQTRARAAERDVARLSDQRRRFCASVQGAMVGARLDVNNGKLSHAQDTLAQQAVAVAYCTDDRVSFPTAVMLNENSPAILAPAIQGAIDELEATLTVGVRGRRP